jgi:hypothetical protein
VCIVRPLDLTGLGIDAALDNGDQILDVVVLMRTANPESAVDGFVIAHTPGLSWLMQVGLIEAARAVACRIDGDDD